MSSAMHAVSQLDSESPIPAQSALTGEQFLVALACGHWRLAAEEDGEAEARLLTFLAVTPNSTERERALLFGTTAGLSNKQLAIEQGIACSTASTLFRSAIGKLGFSDRAAFLRVTASLREHAGELHCWFSADRSRCTIRFEPARRSSLDARLTRAEAQVVSCVLRGATNAAIAADRLTSPHTIANQLASIYRKLGVGSRWGLLARFGNPALALRQSSGKDCVNLPLGRRSRVHHERIDSSPLGCARPQ